MQRSIITIYLTQGQECSSSSTLQDHSQTLLDLKMEKQKLEAEYSAQKELVAQFIALLDLDDINYALNEVMDQNPHLRKLVEGTPCDEFYALKEPEIKIVLILREMMAQFTALKELVDQKPHLRKLAEEIRRQRELDDYSTLRELKTELTRLKESAKAREEELEKELGVMNTRIKVEEEELVETEEVEVEQKETFESVQESCEEKPEFRVLLNSASQSNEELINEQENGILPQIQQELWLQEVTMESDKQSTKKEKKKQEEKEKREKKEKTKQEKKEKQEKKKMEKMERKEMKKIEKEEKEKEKKEKQETKKMEKMERKEMKKIEKDKKEREGTTRGKWYRFLFKVSV